MSANEAFRVDALDHVELLVADRYAAAAWYEKVLGLEIVKAYEDWCEPNRGPLMVSSDGGRTMLALYRGDARVEDAKAGQRVVAFRVSGEQFLAFLDRAAGVELADGQTLNIAREDATDRGHPFSFYLADPWGNRLAVTTYDVKTVRDALADPLEKGFDG
jgi:catechol 2,3-dioxygenase-like lactoylglutathione lyase family enzyme